MKKNRAKAKSRKLYVPPRIVEEEVFERRALATCGKTVVGGCGGGSRAS